MSETPSTYPDTTSSCPPVDTPNVQPSNTIAELPEEPGAYPPHIYTNQNVTPLPLTQQSYPAQQELSPPTQQQSSQNPRLAPSSNPTRSNQQDRFNRNRGQGRGTSKFSTNPMYFKVIIIFTSISMLFSFPIGACATCVAIYAQKQFNNRNYNSALTLSWIAAGLGIASIILSIVAIVVVGLIYSGSLRVRIVV